MTAVFPILSLVNFIIISHSLTDIKDVISIHMFGILFGALLLVVLTVIGVIFKKYQHETDLTVCYENNTSQLRFNLFVLQSIAKHDIYNDKIKDEIEYIKKLLNKTKDV